MYDFSDLSCLFLRWRLEVDGIRQDSGEITELKIVPGGMMEVRIDFHEPQMKSGQECFLCFSFELREDTAWAKAGHVVAWEQFELSFKGNIPAEQDESSQGVSTPSIDESNEMLKVALKDASLLFDRQTGMLKLYDGQSQPVLVSGPSLNLFRCPTDNDGLIKDSYNEGKVIQKWKAAGLDKLRLKTRLIDVKSEGNGVRLELEQEAFGSSKEACAVMKTVCHVGAERLRFEHTITIDEELDDLPRVGIRMTVNGHYSQLEWLGRGPHENYWDRKSGATVGRYHSSVDEMYVPYIRPQEYGNRCDVRELILRTSDGKCLSIFAENVFEFNASRFSQEDLYRARHTNDLQAGEQVIS